MTLRLLRFAVFVLSVVGLAAATASAQTIARCGDGWLEKIDGALVLHLKGSPYEMGYQHGALLKSQVRGNLHNLIEVKAREHTLVEMGPLKVTPRAAVEAIQFIQKPYVAERYIAEMEGVARGSQTELADVRVANFIPELFHCSGFAVSGSATTNGEMYHGRVLDYAVDWGLQDHAVLIVAEPEGRLPWVNVGYAGFIGSVTGMNAEHVSVGEMGGGGLGHWEGRPMSLLVREALETAKSLDEAIAVFRDGPRTCQYFYVIADGETGKAVGMEASWDVFQTIYPGTAHPLLPTAVPDCVLLSAGDRYQELVKRAQQRHGKLTPEIALELMARPVAMKSNLHNVLFAPKSLDLWVAHATSDKQPAADQPYQKFSLKTLLSRKPAGDSPVLPMESAVTAKVSQRSDK
ncbi:MAG: C45 family peptidase [Planctomycetaceae bacterium]|nr:C45 family peptidase [Planctomycetaceae bacterium]